MEITKIKGVIKNYDWGTKDYLASLFGDIDGKTGAEYWMGTHPKGEASLMGGESLSSALGHTLPFLFKVLSIASPLSLQCHPTKKQAEDGWKKEERKRAKGEEYNYQDDNEKAEIISAITPVTALCGFKSYEEIVSSLKKSIPHVYEKYLASFSTIRELFISLFSFESSIKCEILNELQSKVDSSSLPSFSGEYLTEYGIIRETLDKYPGDIGSVFPLMMNVVHLEPYSALYLTPDTLHAYVKGNGIELMTASDNVLRGGLTKKRVDVEELKSIMYFGETEAEECEKREENGVVWYVTPSPSFQLGYVKSNAELNLSDDAVVLSLGKGEIDHNGSVIKLGKGDVYFIPSKTDVKLLADGTLYIATGRA